MPLKTLKPTLKLMANKAKSASADTRITGRRRQQICRNVLATNPLCVHCQAKGVTRLATQVDHITPLWAGGREAENNRQGLCDDCHQAKSNEETRRRLDGDLGF